MQANRLSRGLALKEALLALVVVGLIAGVAAPRMLRQREHPETAIARAQLDALNRALQAYRADVGHFPDAAQGLQVLTQPPAGEDRTRWRGPYLRDAVPVDPWGGRWFYEPQGTAARGYALYSLGRDQAPGGQGEDADIGR
ncbi:type II secretion system major pseudopilin GspG [Azohydromonas aeria]|uniref:type II secretion system major pseudopilin GspG n=1 Tax=Azohydromonas aeria TaxID=2590212 RepID=UPI0012FCF431|nr:type II secretion system major pseudopilin GspG [Azohydromonas aeria]